MQGTIDGFSYGMVTPITAYLMACLGGALGLRCTTRALLVTHSWRPGWLALGAGAIGSGIWTMHFVAMMGFKVREVPIRYDAGMTFASLAVAIVVVGIGVFLVGYRGATVPALLTGGVITGLGVAAMHYLGMAAVHLPGTLRYDPYVVAASLAIAVVAATAALWAAVQVRGIVWSIGASLVMGVAVSGMHYTGMAALSVHLHQQPTLRHGSTSVDLLVPMMIGPLAFLLLASAIVMFDPLMVMGTLDPEKPRTTGNAPAPRQPASWAEDPFDPFRELPDVYARREAASARGGPGAYDGYGESAQYPTVQDPYGQDSYGQVPYGQGPFSSAGPRAEPRY